MEPEIISVTLDLLDALNSADPDAETEHCTVVVDALNHGVRIDKYLAQAFPALSRSYFQQLLAQGDVSCAGKPFAKASSGVKAGERIDVVLRPTEQAKSFLPEAMGLDIVFEDAHLLVLNKPAGLVVHPGAGNWSGTLLNGLLHHFSGAVNLPRAGIVHRLDKDTSGLMVVAKSRVTMDSLVRLISERAVSRLYVAIAERNWSGPERFDVRESMGRDPVNRLRMAVLPPGKPGVKPAHTAFQVLKKNGALALVACKLFTGRTHQIRVHLSWAGHPILADRVYGGHVSHGMSRQALHATRLAFQHPVTGESLNFHAAPPADMQQSLLDAGLHYNTALVDPSVFS